METVAEIKGRLYRYIRSIGGWLEVMESDSYLNDANRAVIKAYKKEHGTAFLGKTNFYDADRIAVAAGTKSPFEKYTGGKIYNFGCDYVIPVEDAELAAMIREYNTDGSYPNAYKLVTKITNRIDQLGGEHPIWS